MELDVDLSVLLWNSQFPDATDAFAVIGKVEEIVGYLEKQGSSFAGDAAQEYAGVERFKIAGSF